MSGDDRHSSSDLQKRTFVARSSRSRRDKADDEDLSRNVGRQARCELERQARIDRLKDGPGWPRFRQHKARPHGRASGNVTLSFLRDVTSRL